MRVNSSQSTSAVGGGPSPDELVQQQLDELQRLTQVVQQQQASGTMTDPAGLEQRINTTLKALQGPQENGQLTPDQDTQLQKTLGALLQHRAQPPGQSEGAGFPKNDSYDPTKVSSHVRHHGGGHSHARAQATPPVDGADPDANALQKDPTAG